MFERYGNYKPSGVEWLGEVPDDWEIKRVKELGKLVLGKMLDNKPEPRKLLKPYLKSKNIGWINLNLKSVEEMFFSHYEIDLYRLKQGDLLFSEGGEVGKTSYWNNELNECYIQNSVHKFTANRKNNARYFLYLSFAAGSRKFYDSIVNFVSIKHLTKEKLSRVIWLSPPLVEQKSIADYLDHKTSQIDQEINLLTQKLEQYSKLKQSLINETVTQGLDKTAKMKGSGIVWLDDIPEHWDVKRIKTICTVFNGATPKSSIEDNWGGNISWVTTDDLGKLKSKYIEVSKRTLTDKGYATSGTTICNTGSIVISGRAPIGHIGILSIPACTNQGCKTLMLSSKVNNLYIYYSLLASKPKLEALGRGTTFIELSTKELGLFQLPLPPLMEQVKIANYLDGKTQKIDQVSQTINDKISKLKELRKTLISDVVTGKIKVVN